MNIQTKANASSCSALEQEAKRLRIERDISRELLRGDAAVSLAKAICSALTRESVCSSAAIILWAGDGDIVQTARTGSCGILDGLLEAPTMKDLPVYAQEAIDAATGITRKRNAPSDVVIHAVRLQNDGRLLGLLVVVQPAAGCEPRDEQWLAALGADIALGLDRRQGWERTRSTESSSAHMQVRLDALTKNVDGMVYRCRNDARWTMTFLSGSVMAVTGYRAEQLLENRERAYSDLIHPDFREWVGKAVQGALEHGQPFKITYPICRPSGETRWVWEQGRAVLDDTGHPSSLEGYITDITELKRAEDMLRESEQRYRLLADNTIDIIWQMDMDLRITYVNPAVEEILGYTPEEFIGTHLSNHCSHATLQTVRDAVATGLQERNAHVRRTLVDHLVHKDGHSVPLEVRARFLYGETSDPIGIQGTSRDISDRLKSEALARRQSERLQTIMDNIPLMISFIDPKGHHSWVNRSWRKTLGWAPSEIEENNLLGECYPDPEYRRYVQDFIKRAEGRWQDFDTRIADGSVRSTVWKYARLTDGSIIGIGEDVTEARQSQKHQQELEEQLRQAQKMEAVGRLAGGVAHDFNNLLAVILGYAELVLETLDSADSHYGPVQDILDAATRARDLTRQLLAFGRKQMLAIEVLDINPVIANFDKLIRRVIGEDIRLDLNLAPMPLQVRADVSQLEQVLMNLAVNARDAMPDGGRLMIETTAVELDGDYAAETPGTRPGDYALIAVSDTGSGMEPATLRRIFEPFYTTKGQDAGTGLGLSTAYGIVKQHGGNIWAYSEPGRGTSFKVYLPLASGEQRTASEAPPSTIPSDPSVAATILVAEDDPNVRRLVDRILNRKGYRVLTAGSVEEAVRIGQDNVGLIDLLLTDVIMPGMTGPELFAQLSSARPEMKVIFMSGYSGEAVSRHGVLNPGTHFLQKPFSVRNLLSNVSETLAG